MRHSVHPPIIHFVSISFSVSHFVCSFFIVLIFFHFSITALYCGVLASQILAQNVTPAAPLTLPSFASKTTSVAAPDTAAATAEAVTAQADSIHTSQQPQQPQDRLVGINVSAAVMQRLAAAFKEAVDALRVEIRENRTRMFSATARELEHEVRGLSCT